MNTKLKGIDDPMTVADVMAQTLIVRGIQKYWPNLKIVGEEEQEYDGDIGFNFEKINKQLIPPEMFTSGK